MAEITSVLDSIKDLLGVGIDPSPFDSSIIMFINGELMVMNQLGVGVNGFKITSRENQWVEFLLDRDDLELVKTDVYLRVKLLFDPPQNSFLVDSIKSKIDEYDWRLELQHKPEVPIVPEDTSDGE